MNTIITRLTKIYGFLLHFYPTKFRTEFGEQMLLDFSELLGDASRKGLLGLIAFCLRELFDFPVSLLQVHLKEGSLYKVLRLRPVNYGLRGAIGFGIAFTLTAPLTTFVYDHLSFSLGATAIYLEPLLYGIFHLERGSGFQFFISSALSSFFTDLLFGLLLAVLFASERSQYFRYMITGFLGWLLYHTMGFMFSAFNFWGFLTAPLYWWFNAMLMAFSGAVFGLVFMIVKSKRWAAIPWLLVGVFVYPLFFYMAAKGLFALSAFSITWRFVAASLLILTFIASVFVAAIRLDDQRRVPWVVVAGAIAGPGSRLVLLAINNLTYPSWLSTDFTLLPISITNGFYGILFGLLLGIGLGVHKENQSPHLI